MAVFTFVCRDTKGTWSAKQHSGDLECTASSVFELQRALTNLALATSGPNSVSSSFSYVTPSSAVYQVILGGGGGGGGFIGGGSAAAAGPSGGGASAAPAAVEEKKEEEKAEESDDDMGFSLFD